MVIAHPDKNKGKLLPKALSCIWGRQLMHGWTSQKIVTLPFLFFPQEFFRGEILNFAAWYFVFDFIPYYQFWLLLPCFQGQICQKVKIKYFYVKVWFHSGHILYDCYMHKLGIHKTFGDWECIEALWLMHFLP